MRKYLILFFIFTFHISYSQVSEVWAATNAFESYIRDMHLDSLGNIYITGKKGDAQDSRILTIKYNNNGGEEWVALHNDTNCMSHAIGMDSIGNTYVTGFIVDSLNFRDIITIKYDINGIEQWVRRYDGNLGSHDEGTNISVSKNGDVYCLGYVNGPAIDRDAILIKYSTIGAFMWVKQINGLQNGDDTGRKIILDSEENIIIACRTIDSVGITPILIVKYDSLGNEIWSRKYFSSYGFGGIAYDLICDHDDNIYCTGALATNAWPDLLICKYDSAGNFKWDSFYNGTGNENEWGASLDIDLNGNIYVAGSAYCGPPCMFNYVTIKLDTSGNQTWVREYDGLIGSPDYGKSISVNSNGNIFVTGDSYFLPNLIPGYNTIMYDSSGTLQWSIRDSSYGEITEIKTDEFNNVYVSGHSARNSNYFHSTTIKYNYQLSSIEQPDTELNSAVISPNPSNGLYTLFTGQKINTITIYDLLGNVVLNRIDEDNIDLAFAAHGMYICKIHFSNNKFQFIKIIKN